jgi:hypothetical protein
MSIFKPLMIKRLPGAQAGAPRGRRPSKATNPRLSSGDLAQKSPCAPKSKKEEERTIMIDHTLALYCT